MYIIRNAIRSILRSFGRTIIICIIVVVCATSACIALSIQQSAGIARKRTESTLRVRAHINVDRQYIMTTMQSSADGSTETMEESVKKITGITLDEMLEYSKASMVHDFYYYSTISLNGDNGLSALNKNDYSGLQSLLQDSQGGEGGGPPGRNQMPSMEEVMATVTFRGDFMVYGYISDASMESFQDGDCYMLSGVMIDPASDAYECIITEELATYNDLEVGDAIVLSNPKLSSERFLFTVVGVYKNSSDTTTTTVQSYDDPANYILTSYPVIQDIISRSKAFHDPAATESTVTLADGSVVEQLLRTDGTVVLKGSTADASAAESSDESSDAEITDSVTGTFVFQTLDDYDAFEVEVRNMGLSSKYTVTSNDVASFEASLVPLDNLSSYANTFLMIVLGVGAVILIGVNFYNIRERKYEIGALTAMGMRKWKVALQFVVELSLVTLLGLMIGLAIGSAVSVPVTNELLSSQITYEQEHSDQTATNFGREVSTSTTKPRGGDVEGEVQYVDAVAFAVDYVVIARMAVIFAALTLLSSAFAITGILRYNPLTILAERN